MHVGSCFCGAVTVEVSGEPEAMGYCHCRSCRSWSGGPVNAFSLWKPAAVRVRSGQRKLGVFQQTTLSDRTFCSQCGGHLLTLHPPIGLVDVFAATLPSLAFRAQRTRQLRRDRAADEGRPAQAQGLPQGIRRLRRSRSRVAMGPEQ